MICTVKHSGLKGISGTHFEAAVGPLWSMSASMRVFQGLVAVQEGTLLVFVRSILRVGIGTI